MHRLALLLAMLVISTGCSEDKKVKLPEAYLQAQTCREQGNTDQAEATAKAYLQQYPDDADMKLLLASIYYQKKDYINAEALLIPAIKQYPNYADLVVLLKRVQEAKRESLMEKPPTMEIGAPVIGSDPDLDKAGIIARANELMKLGEYEAANTLLNNFLKAHPYDVEVRLLSLNSLYRKTQKGVEQARHPCQ